MERITKELRRAVHEYYEWHGDKSAKAVMFVRTKTPEYYTMLLVRFRSSNNEKLSGLMDFQRWADGHWDVTERYVDKREDEDKLVTAFENSECGFICM